MVFAAPVAAAAQSHNTLLRQAPIEVEITLSDPDTVSAWFDLSAVENMANTIALWPQVRMGASAVHRRDSWHTQLEFDDANKRIRAKRGAGSLGTAMTVRTLVIEFMPWVIEDRRVLENVLAAGVSTANNIQEYEDAFDTLSFLRIGLFSLGQTMNDNSFPQSRGHTETNIYFPAQGGDFSQFRTQRVFTTGQATHGFLAVMFSKGVLENNMVLWSGPKVGETWASTQ